MRSEPWLPEIWSSQGFASWQQRGVGGGCACREGSEAAPTPRAAQPPPAPRIILGLDRVPHAPRSMFNGLYVSSSPEILDTGIQVAFLLPRYWPQGCNEGSSVPTLKSARCWLEMDEGTRTMGAERGLGTNPKWCWEPSAKAGGARPATGLGPTQRVFCNPCSQSC